MLDYLISFSAGIVSVLSPCVLPLIPIVVGHSLLRKEPSYTISFVGGIFFVICHHNHLDSTFYYGYKSLPVLL